MDTALCELGIPGLQKFNAELFVMFASSVSLLSLFPFPPVWLPFRVSLFCWRNMSTESVIRWLYFQFDAWRYNNTILLLVLFLVQCFSSVIRLLRLVQTYISHRGLSRSAVRNRQRFASFASFVLFWSCVSLFLIVSYPAGFTLQ